MADWYKILQFSVLSVIAVCLSFSPTHAKPPPIEEAEFRKLVGELALKVDLFKEVWAKDTKAIIYGGTSRDFVYWVLRKLHEGRTPDQLRDLKFIELREVVGSESDADVVTEFRLDIPGERYGIKKVDRIDPARLDTSTKKGQSELHQGFLALEKIEIARDGLRPPTSFHDGVHELFTDQLGFYPTEGEEFWKTEYASQYLNHPVFLAIRYLRIRASHWYNTRGSGLPDKAALLNYDPAIKAKIRALIKSAITDDEFRKVLRNKKALEWLNGSILKSFRSYTNLTAARLLFLDAGFEALQTALPEIETINQFLFLQYRDAKVIRKTFTHYKTSPKKLFVPVDLLIKDRILLHGTKQEESYRAIIFQNALPSEGGSAGAGLYGSDIHHQEIALDYAGGTSDRIVKFEVAESAKIIDLTTQPGKDIYTAWKSEHREGTYDEFARDFGADILKYSYTPYAFVVKNSEVLIKREGLTRKLMTVGEVLDRIKGVQTRKAFLDLLDILRFNAFSDLEIELVLKTLGDSRVAQWFDQSLGAEDFPKYFESLVLSTRVLPESEKLSRLKQILMSGKDLWFGDAIPQGILKVFTGAGLSQEGRDSLADFVVKEGIRPRWFLEIFASDKLGLSPPKTDILVRKLIKDPDLAKDLFDNMVDRVKDVPPNLWHFWIGWLESLVNILGPDPKLITRKTLLNTQPGGFSFFGGDVFSEAPHEWTHTEKFSRLMVKFSTIQDPPIELVEHFARSESDIVVRQWMSHLIKNQTLSDGIKKKMAELIIGRQLESLDCIQFVQDLKLELPEILKLLLNAKEQVEKLRQAKENISRLGASAHSYTMGGNLLTTENAITVEIGSLQQYQLHTLLERDPILKLSKNREEFAKTIAFLERLVPKKTASDWLGQEALRLFHELNKTGISPLTDGRELVFDDQSEVNSCKTAYRNLLLVAFPNEIAQLEAQAVFRASFYFMPTPGAIPWLSDFGMRKVERPLLPMPWGDPKLPIKPNATPTECQDFLLKLISMQRGQEH